MSTATQPYTLLDLALRNGDNVGAVVEEVTTVAPEWGIVPAVPQEGTSYDVLRRTSIPKGAFRNVGDGVKGGKSEWSRETKPMFIFEAAMNVGEDIVKAQTASQKATVGDILADEAIATVKGSTIGFGSQFYYGTKADALGFAGIATQVSALTGADKDNGGGAGATTTSVYLVWLDPSKTNPQGVHFRLGLSGNIQFGEWMKQQIDKGSGKKAMEYVNNFMFYIGLGVSAADAVFRVKKVDAAHPFTDAVGAEILSKVPLSRRANLRWFMNRTAAFGLQNSRSTLVINQGQGGNFAPTPTECQNIPITVTDSLLDTETAGNLA